MKKLFALSLIVLLTGCFGPEKFDAASEATIKESTQKIVSTLPEAKRDEFTKALMYFTMGGSDGFKSMIGTAFSGKSSTVSNEAWISVNLQKINGLNGEQILEKYKANLEEDRIKREKKEAEQKKREKKEAEQKKVKALKNEAQELLDGNKFKEAIAKYKTLSQISSGIGAAGTGIEKTTKAMNEFTEKMNYLNKVTITEFSAERIDTYSKKSVPAVRISLKNNGDRSLDKVKVVVYFQDKNGNTIFEEDYHPVLVSKYSFGSDNKPLKSGYVKEMAKGKYYTLDSALTDWVEGKSVAKVVDVEFSKS